MANSGSWTTGVSDGVSLRSAAAIALPIASDTIGGKAFPTCL